MTRYELVKIEKIKPYGRNPRVITDAAVDAVARSIAAFGFVQPVVVDGDGVVLAGHTRLLAAKKLGLREVPVVRVKDIDAFKARAFRIADNKTAEFSNWDYDLLKEEAACVIASDRDLADAVCLNPWELESILESVCRDNPRAEARPEAPAEKTRQEEACRAAQTGSACGAPSAVAQKTFRTAEGEVYALGDSRLFVGGDLNLSDAILKFFESIANTKAECISKGGVQ